MRARAARPALAAATSPGRCRASRTGCSSSTTCCARGSRRCACPSAPARFSLDRRAGRRAAAPAIAGAELGAAPASPARRPSDLVARALTRPGSACDSASSICCASQRVELAAPRSRARPAGGRRPPALRSRSVAAAAARPARSAVTCRISRAPPGCTIEQLVRCHEAAAAAAGSRATARPAPSSRPPPRARSTRARQPAPANASGGARRRGHRRATARAPRAPASAVRGA